MQLSKLGIEIRKTGNLKNLYSDVDAVLKSKGLLGEASSKILQTQATAHSLQKMISVQHYFDVCTIQNCAELCQICIPDERMTAYRSIHCVHWNQMLPDFRQLIIAMILDDFRSVLNDEEIVVDIQTV
jgi:hypothetical protein